MESKIAVGRAPVSTKENPMTRLGFMVGVAAVVATAGSLSATSTSRFHQKLSRDKQVIHALNRLTFGPRPGDVDRVRRVGVEQWIRRQLQPDLIPAAAALDARLQTLETLQLASWQILEKYPLAPTLPPALVRTPLAQLVNAEQRSTLTTGTPEQRFALITSLPPDVFKMLLPSLTPAMLVGLPELEKQAASARQAETTARQQLLRQLNPPLADVLNADQRRIAQPGTVEEKRALLMSFEPERRRQVLRALPPQALAGLPQELRNESLAARQPPQFVHQQLIDSRLYRALYSNRQLEEVLVDFWLNHFNVFNGKGPTRMLLTSYERDAIRPHVLGRFRDMVLATARHPAMLYYLDNWQSQAPRDDLPPAPNNARRPGLNENYGRELMELHTLGVDGGYTQDDVIAVARAFTGWTIYDVNRIAEFQFNPAFHDRKEKIV